MTSPEQTSPTTLIPRGQDEVRTKLALEALEKENRGLKELVVRLSETVIRHVAQGK